MTDGEVLREIEEILSEYNTTMGTRIKCSGIKPNDHFCNDIGGDSLKLVSMIISFEERFGIEIDERDFVDANPWVMGNLARYIQEKRRKSEEAPQ